MEEKVKTEDYIGEIVKVKIDRPLGSKHPKHGFEYPVNYGYVPNTISGDGEELDCYILGVAEPLEEFEGRCIAVIHRTNDNDDKLVIVPVDLDASCLTDEEIRKQTYFQERWFESVIWRKKEKSCGCIIINDDKVFLIQQLKGFWGFPKGHVEEGETEFETAAREVKEETNIDVEIDWAKRITDEYLTDKGILKEVVFFIAKKIGGNEEMQEEEVKNFGWFTFEEAFDIITYDNTKKVLEKALKEVEE